MQGQDSVAEAQTSSVLQEVTGYPRYHHGTGGCFKGPVGDLFLSGMGAEC